MKVTQEMVDAYVTATRKWSATDDEDPHGGRKAGIQAVLDLIQPAEPFHFAGYPGSTVYLHPTCGTVMDAVPGSDTWDAVQAGECDCENIAPWLPVYVRPVKS